MECDYIIYIFKYPNIKFKYRYIYHIFITIPNKGNMQLCKNYRTTSLISHPSKVLLSDILNRLRLQAEAIISEEQTGILAGRSTSEQIFNLRILCEKYTPSTVFIGFKKALD